GSPDALGRPSVDLPAASLEIQSVNSRSGGLQMLHLPSYLCLERSNGGIAFHAFRRLNEPIRAAWSAQRIITLLGSK
ncbi:hypothetical protein, partial [Variovorax paradoxus]|uniref:hypothetical protein n=1 Tax=Variovorax paradoxus TaxID=34073 RepID=UPI001C0A8DB6